MSCVLCVVYDGKGTLEEGETAEGRFIKIQAAYELLMDTEKRRQYDMDNRVNPMKASQAWMEWLMKKRKAFDQRGDMAVAAWAEQQQLEINLRARRLSRSKVRRLTSIYETFGFPCVESWWIWLRWIRKKRGSYWRRRRKRQESCLTAL